MVSLASTESKWVVDRYEDNSLEGDTVELLLQAGPQHFVAGQEGELEEDHYWTRQNEYNSRSWEPSENGEMARLAAPFSRVTPGKNNTKLPPPTLPCSPRLPTGLSVPTHQHLLAHYELVLVSLALLGHQAPLRLHFSQLPELAPDQPQLEGVGERSPVVKVGW